MESLIEILYIDDSVLSAVEPMQMKGVSMKLIQVSILSLFLISVFGCAAQGAKSKSEATHGAAASQTIIQNNMPNPYGWNATNCAHIMADGNCARPL